LFDLNNSTKPLSVSEAENTDAIEALENFFSLALNFSASLLISYAPALLQNLSSSIRSTFNHTVAFDNFTLSLPNNVGQTYLDTQPGKNLGELTDEQKLDLKIADELVYKAFTPEQILDLGYWQRIVLIHSSSVRQLIKSNSFQVKGNNELTTAQFLQLNHQQLINLMLIDSWNKNTAQHSNIWEFFNLSQLLSLSPEHAQALSNWNVVQLLHRKNLLAATFLQWSCTQASIVQTNFYNYIGYFGLPSEADYNKHYAFMAKLLQVDYILSAQEIKLLSFARELSNMPDAAEQSSNDRPRRYTM